MTRLAYLAFVIGFVGSGIHRGMPALSIVAGLLFFLVMAWAIQGIVGILKGQVMTPGTMLDQREQSRKAAMALRNRPGAMNTDLTGLKLRNKGHATKHMRWVKK